MKNAFFNEVDGRNEKINRYKHPADTFRISDIEHLSTMYTSKDFVDNKGNELDLTLIKKVPIICFFGSNDSLVSVADAKWIKQ